MFDPLFDLGQFWRGIEHIAAWLSISAGMLVLCALIVYFVPPLRKAALFIAGAIVFAMIFMSYGAKLGAEDVHDQWDAANARVAAEILKRDKTAADNASTDETAADAELEGDALKDQGIIDALKKLDATCHPITAGQLR